MFFGNKILNVILSQFCYIFSIVRRRFVSDDDDTDDDDGDDDNNDNDDDNDDIEDDNDDGDDKDTVEPL